MMRRRDLLIGTAAIATVAVLPRPVVARAAIAHDVANVLREISRSSYAATAECRSRPNQQHYEVIHRGWRMTMYRALDPAASWEIQAMVDEAVDPAGRLWDQRDWGIMVADDPLLLLTADERAAFDERVVDDTRWRLKNR